MKKQRDEEIVESVVIEPMQLANAAFLIRGITPLVMHAFGQKSIRMLAEQGKEEEEEGRAKKKSRGPRDLEAAYRQAMHVSKQGWIGIPCSAIRSAMIRACSICGFKMTMAKLSIYVHADGFDKEDGTPLFKITKGRPHMCLHHVRIGNNKTTDLRARAMFDEGWEAIVRIQWESLQFRGSDIFNLLARVGFQVGLLEGRPYSKGSDSPGMGWGQFEVVGGLGRETKTHRRTMQRD